MPVAVLNSVLLFVIEHFPICLFINCLIFFVVFGAFSISLSLSLFFGFFQDLFICDLILFYIGLCLSGKIAFFP
jgi:hypothetical protein